MVLLHDTDDVRRALFDLDYPSAKEAVVACAERNRAAPEVVKALRALPLGEYANEAEVRRSIPLDPAAPRQRTPAERSEQARKPRHGHPGVAEHTHEACPPPLEEELGEPRGHRPAGTAGAARCGRRD